MFIEYALQSALRFPQDSAISDERLILEGKSKE